MNKWVPGLLVLACGLFALATKMILDAHGDELVERAEELAGAAAQLHLAGEDLDCAVRRIRALSVALAQGVSDDSVTTLGG
jgi:hypothetical protein